MPELAVMGTIGFVLCWIVNLIFLWRLRASFSSAKYICMQENLRRVELFWSEHKGELIPADLQTSMQAMVAEDSERIRSSYLTVAILSAFASWLGLLFMVVFIVSMTKLARSRVEMALLASPLAETPDLHPDQVRQMVQQCQQFG